MIAFLIADTSAQAPDGKLLPMPKLDLSDRLNTAMRGNHEVKVSVDGSLGKLVLNDEVNTRVLVYDMTDGAFVFIYHHQGKSKEVTRITDGRFLPGAAAADRVGKPAGCDHQATSPHHAA